MFAFFRRLWHGDDIESERFRQNLDRLEEQAEEIQELKGKLKEVNVRSQEKTEVYRGIHTSLPPKAPAFVGGEEDEEDDG